MADLFEEAGIDYRFGWDRPSEETLVALFSAIDQHFEVRLEPALIRARRAAEALEDVGSRQYAAAVLDVIYRVVSSHMQTVRRSLVQLVVAFDAGVSVTMDSELLRHVALEHATLFARANDLRAQADALEGSEFASAARVLIREIYQHISIADELSIHDLDARESEGAIDDSRVWMSCWIIERPTSWRRSNG